MAKSKTYFEPVDLKVDFPLMEKKLLSDWYKNGGVVSKYLARNKNSKKYFSFLDGPITANNPMGVHHGWGRTYKDLWPRFKSMQGFRQRFQNGFDCQGLWVEVEVEKELGFKNKKDIEKFGVDKFVALCKERVKKYSQIQTEQSKRLGYFADWDNSYYTMSDDNNYMIWHFLKKCHELGWVYKGADSVPWCPRCETAISQHEILTENYKEVSHQSVYLAFPLIGQADEYLLVWTTTPWTIPANIAVAVDENLEYSQVEVGGVKYWLASETKDRVLKGEDYKVLKTTKGSKLVGLKYRGAFDDLPAVKKVANEKFHNVVATDNLIMPITTTEGTGLIHTAVSAGTEDFKLGKKLDLPMIPVINDDASYMEGFDFLSGQNAKKHPELIIDFLKKLDSGGEKFYFKVENYTHRYPACWRCKTELVWKVTDEWYISMDSPSKLKIKNLKFKIGNEKQEETQDNRTLRERMIEVAGKINWIPSFGLDRELDWLGNMHDWLISKKNRYWGLALPIWECFKCGNFEVLGSKNELDERSLKGKLKGSPHKPQIDKIKITCSKCGFEMSRIEPVGNPWLDAGIVAYSTISKDNKSTPLYLSNKRQWENWFPVDLITESFPGQFKNWFYSLIAMSTVMENKEPMKSVLGYGTLLGEDGRAMHKSWGNSIEFNEAADKIGADVMRWMFVRGNPVDNMLFGYKVADETRRRFHLKLWNVYNFFITYANLDGFKPTRNSKLSILDDWILSRLNRTVGIVTENLEKYDAYSASREIEKFVDDLSLWYIRRSRDRVGPAAESKSDKNAFYNTTYYILYTLSKLLAPFMPFMSDLIYTNLTKKESVHLSDYPVANLKNLNFKLIEEMGIVREIVEKAHAIRKEKLIPVKQPLNKFSTTSKPVSKNLEYLIKDEINVKSVNWNSKTDKLDTKITPELEEEMKVRELIRTIQDERKQMGLNLTQRVNVESDWLPVNTKLIQWITKKAQINKLIQGKFNVRKV
ncbi:MAG: isoleucine--tRNA ligase [Patescibacteria group bacterium]